MALKLSWDAASLRRINKVIANVERAKFFGGNRRPLLLDMRQKQAEAWMHDFPNATKRYGGKSNLEKSTIRNRIKQGFAPGPPLVRSGYTQRMFQGVAFNAPTTNSEVFWNIRDYKGASDISAMLALQNEHRHFADLTEDKDLPLHQLRVEQWLGELGRIVVSGR